MLESLPDDILIMILKKLDFQSQANLFEVSECVKRIFMVYKVMKECNICLSTLSTIKTLQTHFFKVIAPNLLKLDLSAVSDLSKTSLMPIMAKLKHLETLNVSYTKINLKDLVSIYKVCPTIKNISIPYNFGSKCPKRLPLSTLLECQKMFQNFECIHFYGNYTDLMGSNSVCFMLQLSKLKILQFTIIGGSKTLYSFEDFGKIQLHCNHIYINHPNVSNILNESFPFNVVELELYEYLIIQSKLEYWDAYGSPVFNNFFKDKFDTKINNSFPTSNDYLLINGNCCIMLWMKNSQAFNEVFFNSLHKIMRQFLVCFTLDNWPVNTISNYDKFCITPKEKESCNKYMTLDFGFKKKRIVTQNHVLDYDEDFREKKEVELNLMFSLYMLRTAMTLNSDCEYLRKITYLNLIGAEKYSATFFNTLFRSCVKLVTLNVAIDNLNANDVARSTPLSHSIKNLRIVAKMIDFNSVLTSLSQCSKLENVHIVDTSRAAPSAVFDPSTMIQKCLNLYCVRIYSCGLTTNKLAEQSKIIEKAKAAFRKPYLSFKALNYLEVSCHFYESKPYVDVFGLNQIKDIKLF